MASNEQHHTLPTLQDQLITPFSKKYNKNEGERLFIVNDVFSMTTDIKNTKNRRAVS
jgi:hypothetical protein